VAEVELPQLGESVTEGIITAWLVEVGDEVEVDQPLVEISTDKVDTEIPSPVAGTVQELRAEVDDTIEVGQVIAVVGEGGAPSGDDGGDEDSEARTPAPRPSPPTTVGTRGRRTRAPTTASAREGRRSLLARPRIARRRRHPKPLRKTSRARPR
jgi:pyruvate/2-oxoglutarate dehydrogenase complex dihydrolipoamide acyltransferase (E2) component